MPWEIYAKAVYVPDLQDLEKQYPRVAKSMRPGGNLFWLWKLVVTKENLLLAMFYADGGRPGVQAVAKLVADSAEFTPPHLRGKRTNKGEEELKSWQNPIKQSVGALIATMLICNGYELNTYIPNDKKQRRVRQAVVSVDRWSKGALFVKSVPPTTPRSVSDILDGLGRHPDIGAR